MTWKGPCPVSLGLRSGLSVPEDHVLVFAQGMAKEEALDSAAGCTSMTQESCEMKAWEAAPGSGLRNPGQSLQTEQVSTQQGRATVNSNAEDTSKHWLVNKSHLLFSLPAPAGRLTPTDPRECTLGTPGHIREVPFDGDTALLVYINM